MSERPLISVIIPVYNAGKYLSACIESLLEQTYQPMEFIFVDDGSSDNSVKICEQYARQDPRIRILFQKHQGPSVARNTGLAASKGALVGFMDADDTISPLTYAKAQQAMAQYQADWVMWDADQSVSWLRGGFIDKEEYQNLVARSVGSRGIGPSLCLQLYKKKIFTDYNIQCPVRLSHYEDLATVMQYALAAANIYYLKDCFFYFHRKVAGSLSQGYKENYAEKLLEFIRYFTKVVPSQPLYVPYLYARINRCVYDLISAETEGNSPLTWNEKKRLFVRFCNAAEVKEALAHLSAKYSGNKFYWLLLWVKHGFFAIAYWQIKLVSKLYTIKRKIYGYRRFGVKNKL